MRKISFSIATMFLTSSILSFASNAVDVTVNHLVGIGGMGSSDGSQNVAQFKYPSDVTIDPKGNIYVLDNNGVRKIDSSNNVTTIYKQSINSGTVFNCGITSDKDSNIWYTDCQKRFLYKLSTTGTLLQTISLPYQQSTWMNGTPSLAAMPDGSILVTLWFDGKLLRVSPNGQVSIYYQNPTGSSCNSYPKPGGSFCPTGVTTSPTGEIYVLNQGSSGNEVLKVNSDSSVTKISSPVNPTVIKYTNGALHIAVGDSSPAQEYRIYKSVSNTSFQLVYSKADDSSRWTTNGFLFIDANNFYVTNYENHLVKKINTSTGNISIIGNSRYGKTDGEVGSATINHPSGITEDSEGNIYFFDFGGVRKISKQGIVSTLYKTQYSTISGLAFYNGRLYFIESNYLKSVDNSGSVQNFVNLNLTGDYPVYDSGGLAVDKSGNFYVLMYKNNDYSSKYIRKFSSTGQFINLNINIPANSEFKYLIDSSDNIYIANSNQIKKYQLSNLDSSTYVGSYSGYGANLALSSLGELYVFSRDQYNSILNVYKPGGIVENIINGESESSVDQGSKSGFGNVSGLLISGTNLAYVSDSDNNSIRTIKISASTPANNNSTSNGNSSSNTSVILRKPRDNNSWTRPANLLQGLSEVRYQGYMYNNTGYFTDSATRTLVTSTLSSRLPIWSDTTDMGVNVSMWWGGYFIPDVTGTWDFQITSDDASFMWIGKDAVASYANGFANAFIALPDDHPPQVKSNSIFLEADKIYPIRIQYGNYAGPTGTFKLEVKSPAYKSAWDTNLEGLIWHSDFSNKEDCGNYGISYLLAAKLGYGVVDVPACVNNPAKIYGNSSSASKPVSPTLKNISISGNTINLSVNISTGSNKPDKVYILVPQLNVGQGSPTANGKINGNTATWSIPITDEAFGKTAQIQIISSKDGLESSPLQKSLAIPSKNVKTSSSKVSAPVVKKPTIPIPQKTTSTQTVICKKGTQARTFAGKTCPPGWK